MSVEPFRLPATVKDRSGTVLASPQCSVFRVTAGTTTSVGQRYDFAGICSPDAADALVGQRNRVITVAGTDYNVLDATLHDVLPHLELALVLVTTDG